MPPDETEIDDLDTEDDAAENQALVELVVADVLPTDDEDIDIRVAESDASEKKEADGEEEDKPREPAKGRLQREQRLKREARDRADRAEAEVQRLNAENAALHAKASQVKPEGSDDDIDREIQAKTEKFRKVRSEFDPDKSDEEAQLIRDLASLEVRKERKKAERSDGSIAPQAATAPAPQASAPAPQASAPKPHPHVQAWLDKNDWFDNPDYERETRRARAIDVQVHSDGYRVEDEDYFDEVERRLEQAGVKIPGHKANGATRKTESPVVAGRIDAPTGKHSVTLTRDDLKFMEQCGLDPRNKVHLKEFAANKLRDERRAS